MRLEKEGAGHLLWFFFHHSSHPNNPQPSCSDTRQRHLWLRELSSAFQLLKFSRLLKHSQRMQAIKEKKKKRGVFQYFLPLKQMRDQSVSSACKNLLKLQKPKVGIKQSLNTSKTIELPGQKLYSCHIPFLCYQVRRLKYSSVCFHVTHYMQEA